MKRRTRIKIIYAIVFFVIGLVIGQLLPSFIGAEKFSFSLSAVGKEDLSGESMKDGDQVKIGVILPLSGDSAILGDSIRDSVLLALSDSGVNNVDLVFEDSKCSPTDALNSVHKLIDVDHVVGIVGDVCSSSTLAVIPVISEAKVPLVSPAASSPLLSNSSEYFFRTVPSVSLEGDAMAGKVINLGFDSVGIIVVNNEFGNGIADSFTSSFVAADGDVVVSEFFSEDDSDFRTQLTNIKETDPDIVYIIASSLQGGEVIRQAREVGIDVPLIASSSLYDDLVLETAGDSAQGLIVAVPVANDDSKFESFSNSFFARYGREPGLFSAQAYDAMQLELYSLKRSDGSSQGLRNALASINNYRGASGVISFDESGDIDRSYSFVKVEDGVFVPI